MKNGTQPISADLAPGDRGALGFDWNGVSIRSVRSASDSLFDTLYGKLWAEFGEKGELETRDVLFRRLAWDPAKLSGSFHLSYEMLAILRGNQFVAVRDHSVMIPEDPRLDVIVHLSHVLIAPEFRRKGLVGWLRAFPLQLARKSLRQLGLRAERGVTLACEMEPMDPDLPDRVARLKSYANAGFTMVDPGSVRYFQPDFGDPEKIDRQGGPKPLPLRLILRRVGKETETEISGQEARNIVQSLYAMYGACFRARDMAPVQDTLKNYPRDSEKIALLSPTRDPGTGHD